MKYFTKISSIIIILALTLSMFVLTTFAASTTTLYFSKNTVKIGEKVTVSVSINQNEAMSNVTFNLKYDSNVLKFENGDGTVGSEGFINLSKSTAGEKKANYSFTFTGLSTGRSIISVIDCIYTNQDGTAQKDFTGATAFLSVKGENVSNNANLKSLKVSGYSLSPSFKSSETSYTIKVPNDVKAISIVAVTDDKYAKTKITGNKNFKVGDNIVTVTVEAPNGNKNNYNITVTREDKEITSSKEEISSKEDTSSNEETTEAVTTGLQTVVDGKTYSIVTEIPDSVIFKGFKKVDTDVNGYTIETAIDSENNYRIFYLIPEGTEDILPYLYDADSDTFERVRYLTIGDNTYIFESMPDDYYYPENLYHSNLNVGDFTVECLADTTDELNHFKYVYCYFNSKYNIYRYDDTEGTLQRYPDLNLETKQTQEKNDNIFTRFGSLSTNGKVIMIALLFAVLGILSLLVLLVVYIIRRSIDRKMDFNDYSVDDDFDEVEVITENSSV